jgi:hypothetical protein
VQVLIDRESGAPTWTAVEYASHFEEVMVDEYQDVNAVQELIFRAVSKEGRNLFLVGDVKQSIYRFRLADPTLFLEKYRSYRPAESAADGEPRRILLRENFRSRRSVIARRPRFPNIMFERLGELDYDGDAGWLWAVDYGDSLIRRRSSVAWMPRRGKEGEYPAPARRRRATCPADRGDAAEGPRCIKRRAAALPSARFRAAAARPWRTGTGVPRAL